MFIYFFLPHIEDRYVYYNDTDNKRKIIDGKEDKLLKQFLCRLIFKRNLKNYFNFIHCKLVLFFSQKYTYLKAIVYAYALKEIVGKVTAY